ncbi:MAG: hypothetical protein ABIP65_08185 [Vicinamibacterales bacterium]
MSSPPASFERRHVVAVEDHLYHTAEMLETIARACPPMLGWTTVCTIDEPGTDTTAAVASWLQRFACAQIAARVDPRDFPPDQAARLVAIDAGQLAEVPAFARMVAALLLPGGVLLQDVHLSTLHCIPSDRWWDSIYVAATVRGMFATRQPAVRFVSNKRGYTATFGRDLMDAGFDPREVMDKGELEQVILPSIARDMDDRFPLELLATDRAAATPIAADEESRREIEDRLDLVAWDVSGRVELGGRLLDASVTFRAGSNEGLTWQQLIADRISGGPGVAVVDVGQRLAETGAERAEISNLAARHVHALRARLSNPGAIVTANHAYQLVPAISAGRVRRRSVTHLR